MNKFIQASKMSGKLEGITGLNTTPLTNAFCLHKCGIRDICYSHKMLKGYRKSANPSFKLNGKNLSQKTLTIEQIRKIRFPLKTVRFNAHGELLNYTHLINLVNIAKYYINAAINNPLFPVKIFALWTKRNDLILLMETNGATIPKNMFLVYSSMNINERESPKDISKLFNKIFTVYNADYAIKNKVKINCSGQKCIECMLCYSKNKTVFINEVEKTEQITFHKYKKESKRGHYAKS